ncbi:MAG: PAS domain-containing protein [Deltaproteobacteria bacterium]|nr:PAS domain-containing protein [Deltaproteobacteria bacterium]
MTPPSLRSRIRNGTLLMLAIALALGIFAVPTVHRLGNAIRETLYRNYTSIEASQHMHAALYNLQLAQANGTLAAALAPNRDRFTHWINVELNDITEVGEAELAADIQRRGTRIFDELANGVHPPDSQEYGELHQRIDELIAMNQAAMFRADGRSTRMSDRLAYEFAAGLLLLLLLGTVLAWTLASNLSRPLAELSDHLRSFSLHGPSVRLGKQPLAELQTVASEFNRMAERLEQFERLNVDRLIYEKGKTEAIIESLEDGIVLIDPGGIVTHMNEIAGIIVGIEREEALGSSFDDLSSNSPHYVRIRAALAHGAAHPEDSQRLEVELHVRGRDHTYVLKPVPLRHMDGGSFGTILILQDITYLRDKDRARTNLVATLSHELNTPLTSLGFCVELLLRKRELDPEQHELLASIQEDVARMRRLASDLMELARGQGPAITVQSMPVDLAEMTQAVIKGFALQAEQKQVRLAANIERPAPQIRGDPLKLSWVVSNLIANALRYTPSGGAISISLDGTGAGARLRVSDTGPGIPSQVREHLFERFAQWRVNGSEPGSAGLGLAIAKEIVDAHGGRIFVDSELGRGTSFTVELPASAEDGFNGKSSGRR